ncbi:orotate phosphoribosyltransferase [Paenibacillus oryzae]|uniref:Orotate phosphoribosyltransferase n=2 Tax=Paenibacillus oryzae TaxID=1844972 RepID=A0A1A5YM84_9BACL|nr:orotate phosphoribosyltransferase [Paenibacillus oryzae]
MLCHLLALSTFIVPLGSILGPLVMWLIKKDQSPYVDAQGKESLNFQISIAIYAIVASILILILIGGILLIGIGIFWLVFVIIASTKANDGIVYRYPLTIRFLK